MADSWSISEALLSPLQADLKAIYEYVNSLQPEAFRSKNQPALTLIQDFQAWKQNLGPLDKLFDQETLNEAKRRRNAINAAMGNTIPLDRVPADNPQQPPAANQWVSKLEDDLSKAPSDVVGLVKTVAVIGAGLLLWNLYQSTKKSAPEHHSEEDDVEKRAYDTLRHSR
jgi:hypothetical protein